MTDRSTDTHRITFVPSMRTIDCGEQTSILSAALDAGIQLPFSCRSGVCRTCRGRITHGEVAHGSVHPAYLTEIDRAKGFAHLCQATPRADCTISIDEVDAGKTFAGKQYPARILELTRPTPDVAIVKLGLPPNEPLRFHAGQYVDILLDGNLRRSYSLANAPRGDGARQIELHIRHLTGGTFTDRVFSTLKIRDMLRIEAPQGQFYLREDSDKPIVLLASGTGFAPIKSIVEYSIARGLRRPIHLFWGGRRRADLYLDALARSWAVEHPHIQYTPVLSEPSAECSWTGPIGFVHRAVAGHVAELANAQVYACGVPVMVEAARQEFCAAGLPEEAFFSDAFVSEADKASNQDLEIAS